MGAIQQKQLDTGEGAAKDAHAFCVGPMAISTDTDEGFVECTDNVLVRLLFAESSRQLLHSHIDTDSAMRAE